MINGGCITLFQQYSFQKGIFIPQHEAFVSRSSMILLQSRQLVFILLDCCFQLLDVFGATLTKGSLCLSVTLLSFLARSIYLMPSSVSLGIGTLFDVPGRKVGFRFKGK